MQPVTGSWTRRQFLGLAAASLGTLAWPLAARAAGDTDRTVPIAAHYLSRPDLAPPSIEVATPTRPVAPGLVFLAPATGAGQQAGALIVDDAGEPIWFHPAAAGTVIHNFTAQRFAGKPVLTWWEGTQTNGQGRGVYVIADDSYRIVKRLTPDDGYLGDLHEFVITSRDTALVTAYASTGTGLTEGVIQEIDIASGDLVFEWHSLDHVGVDESYHPGADYFHLNSVGVLPDGNLLVSARHTSAIYKLDRKTGAIIWRLGGKKSDFAMGPGTVFSLQHDARGHPGDQVTVFDDGGDTSTFSRALTLALDMTGMTARLVRADANPQGQLAVAEGSAQRLATGGMFVGWGTLPSYSEFAADGTLLLDARFVGGATTYRARRNVWTATPAAGPAIGAAKAADGAVQVGVSWNGATAVARWRFLGGGSAKTLRALRTFARAGFETVATFSSPPTFVAAEALAADGAVLGTSKAIRAPSA